MTGTFVDYALPSAADVPSFETDRTETPSPVNSLGVKGVGEAGTIAASAAITNAVIDALRPLGVTLHRHAAQPAADLGGDRGGRGPGGPGPHRRVLGRARQRERRLRTDGAERGR